MLDPLDPNSLTECVKCGADTYQSSDSRNTNCMDCPDGTTTNGEIGSWECGKSPQ